MVINGRRRRRRRRLSWRDAARWRWEAAQKTREQRIRLSHSHTFAMTDTSPAAHAPQRSSSSPPPSSAYLYSGNHPPPPVPTTSDPDTEAALMASMGLPTSLAAFTAESNKDEVYEVCVASMLTSESCTCSLTACSACPQVWSADPAQMAESLALHEARDDRPSRASGASTSSSAAADAAVPSAQSSSCSSSARGDEQERGVGGGSGGGKRARDAKPHAEAALSSDQRTEGEAT